MSDAPLPRQRTARHRACAQARRDWFRTTRSALWRAQVLILDLAKLVACVVVLAWWLQILLAIINA